MELRKAEVVSRTKRKKASKEVFLSLLGNNVTFKTNFARPRLVCGTGCLLESMFGLKGVCSKYAGIWTFRAEILRQI